MVFPEWSGRWLFGWPEEWCGVAPGNGSSRPPSGQLLLVLEWLWGRVHPLAQLFLLGAIHFGPLMDWSAVVHLIMAQEWSSLTSCKMQKILNYLPLHSSSSMPRGRQISPEYLGQSGLEEIFLISEWSALSWAYKKGSQEPSTGSSLPALLLMICLNS